MGKQLDMFPDEVREGEELDAALAKMRLERAARDATKPGARPPFRPKLRFAKGAPCPSCGAYVIVYGR